MRSTFISLRHPEVVLFAKVVNSLNYFIYWFKTYEAFFSWMKRSKFILQCYNGFQNCIPQDKLRFCCTVYISRRINLVNTFSSEFITLVWLKFRTRINFVNLRFHVKRMRNPCILLRWPCTTNKIVFTTSIFQIYIHFKLRLLLSGYGLHISKILRDNI